LFSGGERQELLLRIAAEEPRAPRRLNRAVPAELQTIVLKALEKNPADRYATAEELADDLCRFLADEPIRARRPTLLQRAGKWARRHGTLVRGAAVLAFLLAVVLGISTALVWTAYREKDRQFQRAEKTGRSALEAANYFYTGVAEAWLEGQPELEEVQRI